MRISDWSSDVCSSDLLSPLPGLAQTSAERPPAQQPSAQQPSVQPPVQPPSVDALFDQLYAAGNPIEGRQIEHKIWEAWLVSSSDTIDALMKGGIAVMDTGDYKRADATRSETRRAGKEWVRTCRSGWWRSH